MRTLALAAFAVATAVLADPLMKNAAVRLGPVTTIDCTSDGGITCGRTASTGTGNVRCTLASTVDLGCISTGAQSFKGDKTLQGAQRAQSFGAADAGDYIKLPSGVSIPQQAHLCGYTNGGLNPGGALAKTVTRIKFDSAAQFTELTGTMLRVGVDDGGVAGDGGDQTWAAIIYNLTTAKAICTGNRVACGHAINIFGDSSDAYCGADAGGFAAPGDSIELRIDDRDCLDPPSVNICGGYAGIP